jgi:hypothetical protein
MDSQMTTTRWHWIVVAPLAVVQRAAQTGDFRFCEESSARQLRKEDGLAFYSAVIDSQRKTKCQMFTAIGMVEDDKPESVITDQGEVWFQRRISFFSCQPAPIQPLLPKLSFIHNVQHWGLPFKSGQFEISMEDFLQIAHALRVDWNNKKEKSNAVK